MGYSTDFVGKFVFDKPLAPEHAAYLRAFNNTRRMKRNPTIAETLPDPVRVAASLPIGADGAYFVGGGGDFGQGRDASIMEYNHEPAGQPGLWCKWIPTEDGAGLEWDGAEKFYAYVAWLEYLIEHFAKPWGYVLLGRVSWQGEREDDKGVIVVENNAARTVTGKTQP
jgi:hypothetical protein